MSRIVDAFERAKAENRAALITYLCAGDPNLEESPDLFLAAAAAGADVLEVGVPFSDPTADGPSIQKASERSLAQGATLRKVLGVVEQVRAQTDIPVVLFGYYNPILSFGEAKLAEEARRSGVDGFLVVDLPPEDCGVLREPAIAQGLDYVPLLAPTSGPGREAKAAEVATSFIYYVSLTGVTGAKSADFDEAASRATGLSERTKIPIAVGFGIKSRQDAERVGRHADGVVVGSALVDAVARETSPAARIKAVQRVVGELRAGVEAARRAP